MTHQWCSCRDPNHSSIFLLFTDSKTVTPDELKYSFSLLHGWVWAVKHGCRKSYNGTDCHQYRSAISSFQTHLNATFNILPQFSGPVTPGLPGMTIWAFPLSLDIGLCHLPTQPQQLTLPPAPEKLGNQTERLPASHYHTKLIPAPFFLPFFSLQGAAPSLNTTCLLINWVFQSMNNIYPSIFEAFHFFSKVLHQSSVVHLSPDLLLGFLLS